MVTNLAMVQGQRLLRAKYAILQSLFLVDPNFAGVIGLHDTPHVAEGPSWQKFEKFTSKCINANLGPIWKINWPQGAFWGQCSWGQL